MRGSFHSKRATLLPVVANDGVAQSRVVRASIVIPAHDEECLIGECLRSVANGADGISLEVVVVANGCTDATAEVARAFDELEDLRVLDIPTASKVEALNCGDKVSTTFPRIYLDADIRLGAGALMAMVRTLDRPEPLLAAPRAQIDSSSSSLLVRAFFDIFNRLPYANDTTTAGVYGLSEAGRRRFGAFPAVTADDLFVQRLFAESERELVDAANFVIAPRDLRNLVRVRARVARGNRQLANCDPRSAQEKSPVFQPSTASTTRALLGIAAANPRLLPAGLVYALVTVLARVLARGTSRGWGRDSSTR